MTPRLKILYDKDIIKNLMTKLNYKNKHQAPKLVKIVLNMGLGEDASDGKKIKEDPFYIDKDGNEYSRKQYMDKFGTGMYKSKMVDGSMYATSGKRFRKTKVKPKQFWSGLEKTLYSLREKNENLIILCMPYFKTLIL